MGMQRIKSGKKILSFLSTLSDEGWIAVINNVKTVEKRGKKRKKRGKSFYRRTWKMDARIIDENCLILEKIYAPKFEDKTYM